MSLFRQQPQNRQGRVGWGVGSGEPTTRRGGEKWKTQTDLGRGVVWRRRRQRRRRDHRVEGETDPAQSSEWFPVAWL